MRALLSSLIALSALIFGGCSGMERSEKEKIRRHNCKRDLLYRNHNQYLYAIRDPEPTPRAAYPWEVDHELPRIHKEYFRCRGNALHPPHLKEENSEELLYDCDASRHGLPILRGKEGVYPILLDLLNFVQRKTGKRVCITSGHSCPQHQAYIDSGAKLSKHQIGAEVDFYVHGMEERPEEVAEILLSYFQETAVYQGLKEYQTFRRSSKEDPKGKTPAWYNKEVWIKLYDKGEGRDLDNRHPYPYLSIQVRYDKEAKEQVLYTWEKAYKGYITSY